MTYPRVTETRRHGRRAKRSQRALVTASLLVRPDRPGASDARFKGYKGHA